MKITPEQWVMICTYLRLIIERKPTADTPVWISDYVAHRLEQLIEEIEKANHTEIKGE